MATAVTVNETKKKRNECFDFLKGLACIAVIFMHIELPGQAGIISQCVTRWSVPLFFTISGYYLKSGDSKECINKAKRIAKIALIATVFYAMFFTAEHWIRGDLIEYFNQEVTAVNLLLWASLNNVCYINGAMWFLFALVYTYLAYAAMVKLGLDKYNKRICIVLLVFHFLLSYGPVILQLKSFKTLYRNWLFEGLAFFLLGRFYSEQSSEYRVKKPVLVWGLVIAGLIMSLAERYIIMRESSVHIGSVVILIGLVIWGKGNVLPGNSMTKGMVRLGRDLSLYVYIIHTAVNRLLRPLLKTIGISELPVTQWFMPLLVLLFSVILAYGLYLLLDRHKVEGRMG